MAAERLEALDRLVLAVSTDHKRTFDHFLSAAHEAHLLDGLHGDPAAFLRSLRAGPVADLVASSALRILAARREAVDAAEIKTLLADWLDQTYNRQLAAVYDRPRTRNAYELLNALAPVIPTLEQRADAAISALRALGGVEHLRQEIMRLLNSAAGRAMLRPWLPPAGTGDPLTELFQAAIDLRSAESRDEVGVAYRRLASLGRQLEALVEQQATHYGRALLMRIADAITDAARHKLELKSPPARIVVEVSSRPLPLLEAGVTATLGLTVTNEGDASARSVVLTATPSTDAIQTLTEKVELGTLEPQTQQRARVEILVQKPASEAAIELRTRWANVDHTVGEAAHDATLRAHEVHIDWSALEGLEPFANYPVEQASDLVGRNRQLAALRNAFGQIPLANQYVTGQRRVGKTSLVRVLVDELRRSIPDLLIASVEMGEARAVGGGTTIANLGRKLAQRLLAAAELTDEIALPEFVDSLAPLTDVVEQVLAWDSRLRFLFVIDEFDELPHETYRRDGPGDALFVPMRSLAQKPNIGWLLVGGEKMPFIRDEQATRLNNFRETSLDYLALHEEGRAEHSQDFSDLVRRPLPRDFDVESSAIRAIFRASAGNPHFAKELCATLFPRCVARRDALVSASEVQAAAEAAVRERDVELFAHFWEDGIFDVEAERRQIELDRRTYLMAVAQVLRNGATPTTDRIKAAAGILGLDSQKVDRLHTEYCRRGILDERDRSVSIHVPLFRLWLETEGIYKLPPRGLTEKLGEQATARNQALKISQGEIRRLAQHWERFRYRGERVTRDQIDAWLEQFERASERRLAFRLLERLHVVSESEIFEGFRRLHRQVAMARTVRLKRGQRRLTHVLISAIGGSGSSGEAFAYKYRQANNISQRNLVPEDRVIDRLLASQELTAVVLVDDFIGSGKTVAKSIERLAHRVGELRSRPDVQWFTFAVAGRAAAATEIAESTAGLRLGVQVELALPLSERDMPFSQESTLFSEAERTEAARMLTKYGQSLARWPLGFGDMSALVVFPENCPNNVPAVLWSDIGGWRPLFPRTPR